MYEVIISDSLEDFKVTLPAIPRKGEILKYRRLVKNHRLIYKVEELEGKNSWDTYIAKVVDVMYKIYKDGTQIRIITKDLG